MTPLATTPQPVIELDGDDHVIGDAGAPMTALVFGDYDDAHSRDVYAVLSSYAEPGRALLRIVYRHLPDVDRSRYSYTAALAAETADVQGAFLQMHMRLMDPPQGLGRDALLEYASELNLDVVRFERELRNLVCGARIWRHLQSADAAGIDAAPGVFLDGRQILAAGGRISFLTGLNRALALRRRQLEDELASVRQVPKPFQTV